jgi:hypothetical protein
MPGPLCFWGRAVLRRLELALGRDAISLAHRGEALTLAGVLAGTGGLAALAGTLTLAGVRAHAVAVSGLGIGRDGHASQEQGGSSCGDGGTGFGATFMDHSSERDLATVHRL